jgi:hypothetical protein
MFRTALHLTTGEVITRDGFTFADFTMPIAEPAFA